MHFVGRGQRLTTVVLQHIRQDDRRPDCLLGNLHALRLGCYT